MERRVVLRERVSCLSHATLTRVMAAGEISVQVQGEEIADAVRRVHHEGAEVTLTFLQGLVDQAN